jgi:hypothetical protein
MCRDDEAVGPSEYLADIPDHLFPRVEGRSTGIMRRSTNFCRRLAFARSTTWELEFSRMDRAAAACNMSHKTFFQTEIYGTTPATGSTSGPGATAQGKGTSKGHKGGKSGKAAGKGKSKDKGSRQGKGHSEKTPSRENSVKQEQVKKERGGAEEEDNPEGIDFDGDER